MNKILIAPGLGNSGLQHWQTLWEKENPGYKRIEQKEWEHPICAEWVDTIEHEVARSGESSVIVAHSLACIAVAFWASKTNRHIRGALLVAPADSERADFPQSAVGFTPVPLQAFSFKSIVVCSTNDDYVSLDRAKYFANCWGSSFLNVGAKGHINSSSNLGSWQEGKEILKQLLV